MRPGPLGAAAAAGGAAAGGGGAARAGGAAGYINMIKGKNQNFTPIMLITAIYTLEGAPPRPPKPKPRPRAIF